MADWKKAARAFHESYDTLAFPGGITRQFELLKTGDPEAIEMAVRFLEADPWYFRSGYHKADLLKLLRQQPLTDDQCARLRSLILERVRGRPVRETRAYCRFAPKVTNAGFESEVTTIAQHSNRTAARHAQWILDCLKSAGKASDPRKLLIAVFSPTSFGTAVCRRKVRAANRVRAASGNFHSFLLARSG